MSYIDYIATAQFTKNKKDSPIMNLNTKPEAL